MNILHRFNPIVARLMGSPDFAYKAKHRAESGLAFHGDVTLDHYRKGELIHTQHGSNIFTTEGRNHILEVMFGITGKAAAAGYYVGVFKGDVTPAAGDTAAAKLGTGGTYQACLDADLTPNTDYPVYTIAAAGSSICTNAAAPATFTIVAANITIYGAFLSSVPTKTAATAGSLMCAKRFGTPRAVITSDVLAVSYVITTTSS